MSLSDRYSQYADAFELTFADNDWSRLEQYFTEDAHYKSAAADGPFAFDVQGRAGILDHLKNAVDGFDRRFASRRLDILDGPSEEGNTVQIKWAAIYTLAGAPDVRMTGSETATFDGDRIKTLVDAFDPESATAVGAWMQEHGDKLPAA